jgi:predicted SAM-dependent methyltransferase
VVLRRANIGCGSIQPGDWDNYDSGQPWDVEGALYWDVREPFAHAINTQDDGELLAVFDYAVCSFMLQELNHHEIPGALANMMAILKPGGTLRILVPHLMRAFRFFHDGKEEWFPQDERTGDLDAKFCCYLTWYGTVRSVFTPHYLLTLADQHGHTEWVGYEETRSPHASIVKLDSRPKEALIVEVTKP